MNLYSLILRVIGITKSGQHYHNVVNGEISSLHKCYIYRSLPSNHNLLYLPVWELTREENCMHMH